MFLGCHTTYAHCRKKEVEDGFCPLALPLGMKLSPLRETEQTGGDESMALLSQSRARTDDDDDDTIFVFKKRMNR